MNILEVESYNDTFGPKKKRKRVKLSCTDLESFAKVASSKLDDYQEEKDTNVEKEEHFRPLVRQPVCLTLSLMSMCYFLFPDIT